MGRTTNAVGYDSVFGQWESESRLGRLGRLETGGPGLGRLTVPHVGMLRLNSDLSRLRNTFADMTTTMPAVVETIGRPLVPLPHEPQKTGIANSATLLGSRAASNESEANSWSPSMFSVRSAFCARRVTGCRLQLAGRQGGIRLQHRWSVSRQAQSIPNSQSGTPQLRMGVGTRGSLLAEPLSPICASLEARRSR